MIGALLFVCAFALLLSASGASAAGPTYVYQNISTDTTWNEAGSPYIVNQTVYVQDGVTLTVGPNVTIKVDPAQMIWVNGSLIANGEAARMVNFTMNSTEWNGIIAQKNSVLNFNNVNFNNATGITVQNTGVFTNSKFTYVSSNAIYFQLGSKNGNLTVTNCNFTHIAWNDVLAAITEQSIGIDVVTFNVPISITNNYFGPGLTQDSIQIGVALTSVNRSAMTFTNNIVINNNRFNVGDQPAVAIGRSLSVSDNATATIHGDLNVNTNRFNSGSAVTYTTNVVIHDLASPMLTHVDFANVFSSVHFVNNDVRSGVTGIAVGDIVTASGEKTTSISNPVTVTGNNFTVTGGAVYMQRGATTLENATVAFSGDMLVDKNKMLSVARGVDLLESFIAASAYNDTITNAGDFKVSNNTVTLGSSSFVYDVLQVTALGYGHVTVTGKVLVSDNTILNFGAGTGITASKSITALDNAIVSAVRPLTIVNNNFDIANNFAAVTTTYNSAVKGAITVSGDVLIKNNKASRIALTDIAVTKTTTVVQDGKVSDSCKLTVLDNKMNSTSAMGVSVTVVETSAVNGSAVLEMPIEVSRNVIKTPNGNAVAIQFTIIASDNAVASQTGAITCDSNTVIQATNGFVVSRALSSNSVYNATASMVSGLVFTNNVMNTLTGNGIWVNDDVSAGGYKTLTFNSPFTATGNSLNSGSGRMIWLDRSGISSVNNAKIVVSSAVTVQNNVATACNDLIRVDMKYTANDKSSIIATGDIKVDSNKGMDVATRGIDVWSYSTTNDDAAITNTLNIDVSDNVLEQSLGYTVDVERDLQTNDNSVGTVTGTVTVMRNNVVAKGGQGFYAENYVESYDNSTGLIAGDFTVSNNTMTSNDVRGFDVEIMAEASVKLVGMSTVATYNGNTLIADNTVTLMNASSSGDQYYIYFWAGSYANLAGSTMGSKWANVTMGNIQVLRNTVVMNGGSDAVGIEYDPDVEAVATYGASVSTVVGTQMIANNDVVANGNNFYGIYFYGDHLYASSNVGNATCVSGAITFRDNTVNMKGNGSYGIYLDMNHDIYAMANTHWLASFVLTGGLTFDSNSIVMKGNNNIGFENHNINSKIYTRTNDLAALSALEFNIIIENNVVSLFGDNGVGMDLNNISLYAYYWDGSVSLKCNINVIDNNVKLSGQTGVGILVDVIREIDVGSFNGHATVVAVTTITNNIVSGGNIGIQLVGSGDATVVVTGNKVTGTFGSAMAMSNSNAIIEDNVITENEGNGIYLSSNLNSTNIVVGNNTITHNGGTGLWIVESSGVTLYNGIFESNMNSGINVPLGYLYGMPPTYGSQVLWIVDAAALVRDNDVFIAGNVDVKSGTLTLDSVNTFTVGESYTGITQMSIESGATLIVLNSNLYSDNGRGLFLVYGTLQMTSSGEYSWSQIYLAPTAAAKITASTIAGNDRNGIYIDGCSPTISSTTIAINNMDGVYVANGSAPTIKSCLIAMNERGIYAKNANLNNVVDNIFLVNYVAGVYADGVVGKIHANTFLLDKNEIFVYNSVVSVEDNEIGYARLVDKMTKYSTLVSLALSYLDTSSLTSGMTSTDLLGVSGLSLPSSMTTLSSLLLEHVGLYVVNSDVTAKDNTYGMLTYAVYAENSNVTFSDSVMQNNIVMDWLNKNLDSRNITIPTFMYNGIYMIDSKLIMDGASIQCDNDAVFLDHSSAVISNSVLNASRFDIYSIHNSNVSVTTTTFDGKLKVEDAGWITWLNQFTVIVKDADGKLVEGAPVTVTDANGKLIASGNTSSNGQFLADVIGWTQTENGKQTVSAPYWVNATVNGKNVAQSVDGSQSQTVTAQGEKSTLDTVMLPLLLIIALIVLVVVILVVLRTRKN